MQLLIRHLYTKVISYNELLNYLTMATLNGFYYKECL